MLVPVARIPLVFSLLLISTGCLRKSHKQPVFFDPSRDQVRLVQDNSIQEPEEQTVQTSTVPLAQAVKQYEARAADAFIPLDAIPVAFDNSHVNQVTVEYGSYRQQQEIAAACLPDMERMGWNCIAEFKGNDLLFVFEKPRKLCVITFKTVTSTWAQDKQQIVVRTQANIRP